MENLSANHMMIDLETLGITPDSAVLTIGALIFNPTHNDIDNYLNHNGKLDESRCFYKKVSIESCLDIGCIVDDSTLQWWSQQNPKAIEDAFSEEGREPFKDVLRELFKFGRSAKCVWAKGPQFDAVILETAAKKLGVGVPWNYWQLRDVRTVEDMIDFESNTTNTHNALEDCIFQALAIQKFHKKLQESKYFNENQ